ncbi:hypothetical protein Purlil1_12650 [Purpureocillium lilacinum]|uniref:C2H2-type domain-containing protein n=1 Tax=Purpureocillium lilacinum TaxID=33203 RepID=A0ABR0BGG4_PURLI|nr:hypothetical protein Purlil1_12650 [Purpureocillium lilacinum]
MGRKENPRPDQVLALPLIIPEDSQNLLPTYPSDGLYGDEEAAMQDADAWLQTMAVDNGGNRLNDPANNEPSPITSIVPDTRTAQGQIFKACKCPEHQNVYSAWPTHNAELTIAHCMKTCIYCGKDFSVAGALRKHIRKAEYAQRNLKVRSENPQLFGRGPAQPGVDPSQTVPMQHPSMVGHPGLRILQYNVWKSRDVVLASLFQNQRILEYDILAIQEPWRNPFIATTYHPLKGHFHLTFLDNDATRNEVETNTLTILAETLRKLEPDTKTVVLGDFNLHHPLWSTRHRRPIHGRNTQQLLAVIEDFQLELLTVPGTPTHRWKDGESTIDLTFATANVAPHVVHCKIDRELDCESDHLPVAVAIEWEWKAASPAKKRLWTKMNIPILRQTVQDRLPRHCETTVLRDRDDIDALVASIINALGEGIDASTPWSSPSPRSIAGFDQECKDICSEVQRLRRRWQQRATKTTYCGQRPCPPF